MKGFFKPVLLLSGMTLALVGPLPLAIASPESGQTTFSEKGPHKDRGVHLTEIVAPMVKPAVPIFSTKVNKQNKTQVTTAHVKSPTKTVKAISNTNNTKTKKTKTNEPLVLPETTQVIPASSSSIVADSAMNSVTAWLDRPGNNPRYKVGDKMVINVRANTDLNVLVFNYDAKGKLIQIFPNNYQQSGFLKAGEHVQIGGPDSPFDYEIGGKGGIERIFVYSYPSGSSEPITVAMTPVPNSPFRAAELSLEKYRELVNKSKVFFAREVKVVPKSNYKLISNQPAASSNKVELIFQVDAK
jgi:hypothetical protein